MGWNKNQKSILDAFANGALKMKELEEKTGLCRQTIASYLRDDDFKDMIDEIKANFIQKYNKDKGACKGNVRKNSYNFYPFKYDYLEIMKALKEESLGGDKDAIETYLKYAKNYKDLFGFEGIEANNYSKKAYQENARYPNEFYKIRQKILERDNHVCQLCGKRGKCVHHIDGNKLNNNPQNLIVLCSGCNLKVARKNRSKFEKYFIKKIELIYKQGEEKKTIQ